MVSHFANSAVQRRRTMKLCGHIGRTEILVLVDYDSVGTFVSTRLVDQLQLDTRSIEPTRFVAANGSPMIFSLRVPNLQWSIQNHSFISDAAVLPLKCFDLVLSEDWFEECSPMWVDWVKKIMCFTLRNQRVTLFGL